MIRILLLLSLFNGLIASAAPARTVSNTVSMARTLINKQDYLGFRIWVKKVYARPMNQAQWYDIKNLIAFYSGKTGFDLIPFWNARNAKAKNSIDRSLENADALMLSNRFEEAFAEYQKVALKLKQLDKTRFDAKYVLPSVIHAMGRALYGAGRYEESMKVYQSISANYPRFRQVLFEKMWAAFKAGRVEIALGAVASQSSVYFSRFLSPEAYLIQSYLYKRLCREDDLKQVVSEMKAFEQSLQKGELKEWVGNDVETLTLWHLAEIKPGDQDDRTVITPTERVREQNEIRSALQKAFEKARPKLLADLKTAQAYAYLAKVTDTKEVLKPIEKLKSREELSKLDLEIWPADSSEEWLDELGKHVLIGESLCR